MTYTSNTNATLNGLTKEVTYRVEIKAVMPDQSKSTIGTINLTPGSGGPLDGSVSVEGSGSTWASVSWPSQAGASGYQVIQDGAFVTYTSNTNATLNGLTKEVTYRVEIKAVMPDQSKSTIGTINLTARPRSGKAERSDTDRENDLVDPDGDASGWEDNPGWSRSRYANNLNYEAYDKYLKGKEEAAGRARKDFSDVLQAFAKDLGLGVLGWVGSIIGFFGHADDVDEYNRMVNELAERGRKINEVEEANERLERRNKELEDLLQETRETIDRIRAMELETELKKGNRELAINRKRLNVIYREMYELEQAELRYGELVLRTIPQICVQNDTFNEHRCGRGFEAWWELGRNILHLPRYCARSNDTYGCATGGRALHPENLRRPAFGEFKCEANGAVYWSNGRNAHSQVANNNPTRCSDVHSSWTFTGKYRPRTGGEIKYRALTDLDCPIQGENGQLTLSCRDEIVDVDPPGYPWGCVEHDNTGSWKCPGDTSYSRPEPVDTSTQVTKPKGDFTCQFNGLRYYSNGTAYRLKAAKISDVDQWLCRDVTLVFHVYCNGQLAREVTPPNRKKQTCGSSSDAGWIPPVGNFTCPANKMRYYSNGRNAYLHHTTGTAVPCPDVSPKMRFDGKSG